VKYRRDVLRLKAASNCFIDPKVSMMRDVGWLGMARDGNEMRVWLLP
jgi:hypothetical protein